MTDGEVVLIVKEAEVWTLGLADRGHPELKVCVGDRMLIQEGEVFARTLVDCVVRQGMRFKSDETFAYGYWLTSFKTAQEGSLEIWEYEPGATHWVPGARLTLTHWRDQHAVCQRYGAAFSAPRLDKLTVISAGVLEGDAVQGVRYPSPGHMSGWWLTTDRYDGNSKSLRTEHLYHVTAARQELSRYLALPYGFRFDLSKGEDVWFEESVANQPSS